MRRREFIRFLGVTALSAWPLIARGQQSSLPVVGFVDVGSVDASASRAAAFRKGLNEAGYTEGQNVMVEYHWLDGRYDRAAAVMADLVSRKVAVIATTVTVTARAAQLRQRRSQLILVPVMTPYSLASSRASHGLGVTRPASICSRWK